jgi:hypothetical protein
LIVNAEKRLVPWAVLVVARTLTVSSPLPVFRTVGNEVKAAVLMTVYVLLPEPPKMVSLSS